MEKDYIKEYAQLMRKYTEEIENEFNKDLFDEDELNSFAQDMCDMQNRLLKITQWNTVRKNLKD